MFFRLQRCFLDYKIVETSKPFRSIITECQTSPSLEARKKKIQTFNYNKKEISRALF